MPRLSFVSFVAAQLILASSASAVSDRNLTERGQMPPFVDTSHPIGHANAMMQERYAQAGGPSERGVTAFAEDVVKTLPLIPGASVLAPGTALPSGNILIGSGRGIGFSSLSLHDQVTGSVVWSAPRYLGPVDYLTQRTIGPGGWTQPTPSVGDEGVAFLSDGHNVWALNAESGEEVWVRSQSEWPPGPQRVREERLRPQNMSGDFSVVLPFLPKAVKAPSGQPVVGSIFTRGNFAYVDSADGSTVAIVNADIDNLGVGFNSPILFLIIELVCYPSGEIALEIKDFCTAALYTRYFSVNTVMADPVRNRVTITYAGDGETFDRLMTWGLVTEELASGDPAVNPETGFPDPGESPVWGPGTISTEDTDGDGFPDAGLVPLWSQDLGLHSGATPTWSDSGALIFGADQAGITYTFDANTGEIRTTSTGAAAGFSPSSDHNDLLITCANKAGIAQTSPVDGSVLFQNSPRFTLGIEHLPVVPDAPLLASGRPEAQCSGFPATHPDVYQAQYVLGYPITLFEALASLGIPLVGTISPQATVDYYVDAQSGEAVSTTRRSIYNGSAESTVMTLDSGRFVSARVDALAAMTSGVINLLLPRRFDAPPAEGGLVISEPLSFRDALQSQYQGIVQYCDEILQGRFAPDGTTITRPLPIEATPDSEEERQLQLNVNKVGYINAIAKHAIPGRMGSATNRVPPEIGFNDQTVLSALNEEIVEAATTARQLLLSVAPGSPDTQTQNIARAALQPACLAAEQAVAWLQELTPECELDTDCDGGTVCLATSCASNGLCAAEPTEVGLPCEEGGSCDGSGVCIPEGFLFCKGAQAIIAKTSLPSRTVVYNDLDAFTGSDALPYDGAEQLPLTTRQFVGLGTTSTGASYRQTIMCKMKSWDALETYYPGSAAPGSSCSTINQASYALVLEGLAEGEVPVVTEFVFDEWESFAGSQWTSQSPAVTAYTSNVDGKVHVVGKALYVERTDPTIFIGPEKKGVHYCQVAAPDYLRELILGNVVAPSCDPPPVYEPPVLLPTVPLWDCENP